MCDNSGFPRYAIYILHIASRHLDADAHAEFAAGFDAVASRVLELRGIHVGFTLDLLPTAHTYQIGDARGWVPWFEPRGNIRIKRGSPITQTWANRDHRDLYAIDVHGIVATTSWDQAEPAGYRPDGWFPIHRDPSSNPARS